MAAYIASIWLNIISSCSLVGVGRITPLLHWCIASVEKPAIYQWSVMSNTHDVVSISSQTQSHRVVCHNHVANHDLATRSLHMSALQVLAGALSPCLSIHVTSPTFCVCTALCWEWSFLLSGEIWRQGGWLQDWIPNWEAVFRSYCNSGLLCPPAQRHTQHEQWMYCGEW